MRHAKYPNSDKSVKRFDAWVEIPLQVVLQVLLECRTLTVIDDRCERIIHLEEVTI